MTKAEEYRQKLDKQQKLNNKIKIKKEEIRKLWLEILDNGQEMYDLENERIFDKDDETFNIHWEDGSIFRVEKI